jgi:hypothetical protein
VRQYGGSILNAYLHPALARAFAAFQRRDFGAIDAIGPVFCERERISGRGAEIDLVEFTLLKAYLATGRLDNAHRLLQHGECRRDQIGTPVRYAF